MSIDTVILGTYIIHLYAATLKYSNMAITKYQLTQFYVTKLTIQLRLSENVCFPRDHITNQIL